jgi:hypothetical protein
VGKLPKTLQRGGGNPIDLAFALLHIGTRKEEYPAIRRKTGSILVYRGIESLSHIDRRGPASMSVIETNEEI